MRMLPMALVAAAWGCGHTDPSPLQAAALQVATSPAPVPRGNVADSRPAPRIADPATCGTAALPPCALRDWMEANLAPALRRKDFAALQTSFKVLAGYAPDGYSGWVEMSDLGGDAAAQGSIENIRQTCAGCHARHRSRYRSELRVRALPHRDGG